MLLWVSLARDIILAQNSSKDAGGDEMSPEERKEFINIFNEGFEQIVLPYFARIQEEIAGIHIELTDVKQDVSGLKEDVSGIKQELSAVKQDVAGLKEDVSELKRDVSGLKEDVSQLKEDVSGIKQELTEIKETLQDHGIRFIRVERKLDAVVTRQDEQGIEIKQLKDKLA